MNQSNLSNQQSTSLSSFRLSQLLSAIDWKFYSLVVQDTLKSVVIFFVLLIRGLVLAITPSSWQYKDICDQIALVTGAGSGLGRGLCIRLAERGARVVAVDINSDAVAETVRLIKENGGHAYDYVCDISNCQKVLELAAQVREQVGSVDILFNNAGVVSGKRFLEITEQDVQKTFAVNTFANFWTCRAFLPEMRKRNQGHIITIASLAGLTGCVQLVDYCASKFAAVGFLESLRVELAADGLNNIKCTCVCPFFINTGMFKGAQSSIVPILEQDYAVDKIMSAMLTDQQLLVMPRIFYLVGVFKSCLPSEPFDFVYQKLGGYSFMNKFVGRAKST